MVRKVQKSKTRGAVRGGARRVPKVRMADDAAPVVFKKPARKANMRKRKVEVDANVDAGEAGEASGGTRCAGGPGRTHTLRHTRLELRDECCVAVRRSR